MNDGVISLDRSARALDKKKKAICTSAAWTQGQCLRHSGWPLEASHELYSMDAWPNAWVTEAGEGEKCRFWNAGLETSVPCHPSPPRVQMDRSWPAQEDTDEGRSLADAKHRSLFENLE